MIHEVSIFSGRYYDVFPIGPTDAIDEHAGSGDSLPTPPVTWSCRRVVTMLSTLIYTRAHKEHGPGDAAYEPPHRHEADSQFVRHGVSVHDLKPAR